MRSVNKDIHGVSEEQLTLTMYLAIAFLLLVVLWNMCLKPHFQYARYCWRSWDMNLRFSLAIVEFSLGWYIHRLVGAWTELHSFFLSSSSSSPSSSCPSSGSMFFAFQLSPLPSSSPLILGVDVRFVGRFLVYALPIDDDPYSLIDEMLGPAIQFSMIRPMSWIIFPRPIMSANMTPPSSFPLRTSRPIPYSW